jgi:hypothetical protein
MKNRLGKSFVKPMQSRSHRLRKLQLESLEGRRLLAADTSLSSNFLIAEDVNKDFRVSAMDALVVINHLNARSASQGEGEFGGGSNAPFALDVNRDGRLSALDALHVINRLNGEGEDNLLMVYSYSITNVVSPNETASAASISQIAVGQTFQVNVFVKDNRDINSLPTNEDGMKVGGPFSAGMDMGLSSTSLATYQFSTNFRSGVLFSSGFTSGRTATQGTPEDEQFFNEVFAAGGSTTPPENPVDPKPFYSLRFVANTPGTLTFNPNGPEDIDSENLLFGSLEVIPNSSISFGNPFSITIISDPTGPVVVNDNLTTNEDTSLTIQNSVLLSNDSSGATPPRVLTVSSIQSIAGTTQGTLIGNVYTPPADFNGTDLLTYTVTDSSGLTATGTITITVNAVNDPPVAGDDNFSVILDSADNPLNVLANDSPGPANESTQTLTITGVSAASNGGTVTIAPGGGSLIYTPNPSFIGTETFTYTVQDNGNPALSDTATVTVDVQPANRPFAVRDTRTVSEDSSNNSIDVLANDLVNEGQTPVLVAVVTEPANGTATIDGNVIRYTPDPDFFGTDVFTYSMNETNSEEENSIGTVTITVTNVNDAPILADDSAQAEENVVRRIPFADLLANDSAGPGEDAIQTLVITSVSTITSAGGSVAIDGTDVVYTPTPTFAGTFFFTYHATDDGTPPLRSELPATVTVTVNEFNDPPVLQDDSADGVEGSPVTIALTTLLANDSPGPNESNQTLTVTGVTAVTANAGTVQIVGPNVVYTPEADFNGPFIFTYTAIDNGFPAKSGTATVTITMAAVNDPPVVGNDTVRAFKNNELRIPISQLLANDSPGPENESDQILTLISVQSPVNGTVQLDSATGHVVFTPATDFVGVASFQYTVQDNGGGTNNSASGTVTVNVEEFQPSVIAGKAWVDENQNGVIDSTERMLGGVKVTLTGSSLGQPVPARTVLTLADGTYDFEDLGPGSYQISFQAPAFMLPSSTIGNTHNVQIAEPGGLTLAQNYAVIGLSAQYAQWVSQLVSQYYYTDPSMAVRGAMFALGSDNSLLWGMKLDGYASAKFTEAVFDGDALLLTTVDANNAVRTARLARGAYSFVRDSVTGNTLVRVIGSMTDFQWSLVDRDDPAYDAPRYLDAVDDVFAQEGWQDPI